MKPLFFGQYLLDKEVITEQQLNDAVEYQRNHVERIGEIAVKEGYLTRDQARKVNFEQRLTDKMFGELAVSMGYLNEEQLERILTEQKNNHVHIGEALVKKGALTEQDLKRYLIDYNEEQKPISSYWDIIPRHLDIRNEVYALIDASVKIFRRMANLQLKLGTGEFTSAKTENLYVISSVDFKGDLEFKNVLNFTQDAACALVRNLFDDMEMECDEETVSDCVGELSNVISGNLRSRIVDMGKNVEFSLPELFLKGGPTALDVKTDHQALVFEGSVTSGYVELCVIWTPKGT